MQQVTLEEAKVHLGELIDAALQGEMVFIRPGEGQPMVQLVPLPIPLRRPQFGGARGLIQMTDDFDAPLDDFQDYMG
ncbi:MAG: DUF2281 domain-containing protein [Ardenticatenales bacterium]|nr:DUF2281 domain-containing protein [Ardenticatenales bacterium]